MRCLSWEGFSVQVGDEILDPGVRRSDAQVATQDRLQHNPGVGTHLAGLDVFEDPLLGNGCLIETEAAFFGSSATKTLGQCDSGQRQEEHRQSEAGGGHVGQGQQV